MNLDTRSCNLLVQIDTQEQYLVCKCLQQIKLSICKQLFQQMADLNDDDHLFEEISPECPGTIRRNIVRRLGLASQVAEAIRSPNSNTSAYKVNLDTRSCNLLVQIDTQEQYLVCKCLQQIKPYFPRYEALIILNYTYYSTSYYKFKK